MHLIPFLEGTRNPLWRLPEFPHLNVDVSNRHGVTSHRVMEPMDAATPLCHPCLVNSLKYRENEDSKFNIDKYSLPMTT
jgi:hypothetical protein